MSFFLGQSTHGGRESERTHEVVEREGPLETLNAVALNKGPFWDMFM